MPKKKTEWGDLRNLSAFFFYIYTNLSLAFTRYGHRQCYLFSSNSPTFISSKVRISSPLESISWDQPLLDQLELSISWQIKRPLYRAILEYQVQHVMQYSLRIQLGGTPNGVYPPTTTVNTNIPQLWYVSLHGVFQTQGFSRTQSDQAIRGIKQRQRVVEKLQQCWQSSPQPWEPQDIRPKERLKWTSLESLSRGLAQQQLLRSVLYKKNAYLLLGKFGTNKDCASWS